MANIKTYFPFLGDDQVLYMRHVNARKKEIVHGQTRASQHEWAAKINKNNATNARKPDIFNPQIENNLGLTKKLRNAIDARIGRN